jgi:hypothetical protein
MPKCPKCGRPMATVLKRERGAIKMYYDCPACPVATHEPADTERGRDRCRWCGALLTRNDFEDECERCRKTREANQPERE